MYSGLLETIFGVPQGSILLFNIILIEFFFAIADTCIASYTNDNTLYVSVDNIDRVITSLEEASEIVFNDTMKAFFCYCHTLF